MFSQYYQKGMCVIPLKNGKPLISWSDYYNPEKNWRPDEETLKQWDSIKNPELAILCGKESQIVAIDIDIEDEKKIKILQHTLGNPKCAKIGSKGITFFFKYNNEPSKSYCKDGVTVIEVLSDKRLTTLPPSKHRNKDVFYKWANISLLESELTYLPASYDTFIRSIFDIKEEKKYEFIEKDKYSYEKTPELQDAEKLVYDYCNADCSREEWVILGNALRYCFGDAAFYLFDDWSSKSKKYKKSEIRNVWRSFDRPSNYGAIVNIAKRYGYKLEKSQPLKTIAIDIDHINKKYLDRVAEEVKKSNSNPEIYENAPTDIKTICDWIVSTAYYPQPIITLGAVVTTLGFIMNKKVKFHGKKPNLYTVCLGRTTAGKDHIQRCIGLILNYCELGKTRSRDATSDTAVVKKINKNDGLGFYFMDEGFKFVRALTSISGNLREKALSSLFLEAYTGDEVSTADKADIEKEPTITVKNPFLSLLMFSTAEPFFDAVGSKEAYSGFVGRLCLFEAPEFLPEPNLNHGHISDEELPLNVKNILDKYNQTGDKLTYKNNSINFTKIIACESDVKETLDLMKIELTKKINNFIAENNPMQFFIPRLVEIAIKYSLIAGAGQAVSLNHLKWASKLAEYNISVSCSRANDIQDKSFDGKVNKLLNWIEKQGGLVDKTRLNNFCKFFDNRREREEAIKELIEREKIEEINLDDKVRLRLGYKIKTPQA